MEKSLIESLRTQPIFKSIDSEGLKALAGLFSHTSFESDQHVFHQGDEADNLFIILAGRVSIETYTEDGKMTQFTHLGPGDIFGEFAVLDEGVRSAGARILERAKLAKLKKSDFHNLLNSNPVILKQLLSFLVSRLRHSNHQIESLATQSLLQRTAHLLVSLSSADGDVLKVTQKQLSGRLFASREKVNVKLKALESKGAIKCGHGKITIISLHDLHKVYS